MRRMLYGLVAVPFSWTGAGMAEPGVENVLMQSHQHIEILQFIAKALSHNTYVFGGRNKLKR